MKYILYGAGHKGKTDLNMLLEHNLKIIGFCDSNKAGSVVKSDAGEFPVYSVEEIRKEFKEDRDVKVIISIANRAEYVKVENMLREEGITVTEIERELYGGMNDKRINSRKYIAEYHINEMDSYFKYAETEEGMHKFWGKDSVFYKMFMQLNLESVVELACGRGRHVPKYIKEAKEIVLVDILEKNISICQDRFKGDSRICYYVNNGYDLNRLESDSYTAVFSYDAMVHFEMLDIFSYLKEIERILRPGGKALIHHSNNTEDYRITFSTGTNGRNYMSAELFAHLGNRAGLEILDQQLIDWGGAKESDCLTLLEKPL